MAAHAPRRAGGGDGPAGSPAAAHEVALRRARAQLLDARPGREPGTIVRHLVAVQAQDARACALALRARGSGFSAGDVASAGDLVVGWLLRGTLHLVRVDDWWWLHALVAAPRAARVPSEPRDVALVEAVLADRGPLDRPALIAALAERGLVLRGQQFPHLVRDCCLLGEVVLRPDRRYVVASTWVGDRPPDAARDAALRELGARYATAHPGADAADLAAWSGLGLREARVATEGFGAAGGGGADAAGGDRAGSLDVDAGGPVPPRLLPAFDPLLLGWKDRSPVVPAALAKTVHPGGGMLRAVTLDEGVVTGTWTLPGGAPRLDAPHPDRYADEIADVIRFEGRT